MKTKAPMKPNTKADCHSVEISDIDRAFIMFTERFWWQGNVTPCLILSEYERCALGQNMFNFVWKIFFQSFRIFDGFTGGIFSSILKCL